MSRYYAGWAPYVPVAERRRQAEGALMKLARKGQIISPVKIAGKIIASTFWGKAWCDNLERYQDFENRLPRGRTYVRNGSVVDLQISRCEVRAMVSGSSLYDVTVSVGVLPKAQWRMICRDCAGGIDSVVELLQGRLSKSIMERVCQPGKGLFPQPSEIKFTCSCPDYAFMCKHIAAVLYGVGARLDEQPELLFQLRAVDQKELINSLDDGLLSKTGADTATVLANEDLSALFGLDMADEILSSNAPATTKESRTKPAKGERGKSAARAVQHERNIPNRTAAASPKASGTTKIASTAKTRVKVAAPKRAKAPKPKTLATTKRSANTTKSTKNGGTPTPPRRRRRRSARLPEAKS